MLYLEQEKYFFLNNTWKLIYLFINIFKCPRLVKWLCMKIEFKLRKCKNKFIQSSQC